MSTDEAIGRVLNVSDMGNTANEAIHGMENAMDDVYVPRVLEYTSREEELKLNVKLLESWGYVITDDRES